MTRHQECIGHGLRRAAGPGLFGQESGSSCRNLGRSSLNCAEILTRTCCKISAVVPTIQERVLDPGVQWKPAYIGKYWTMLPRPCQEGRSANQDDAESPPNVVLILLLKLVLLWICQTLTLACSGSKQPASQHSHQHFVDSILLKQHFHSRKVRGDDDSRT